MIKSTVKKLPDSELEIEAEIDAPVFDAFRGAAIKNISSGADIPGFRPGTAPESIVRQKYGEETIREEMARIAVQSHYPEILKDKDIDAIGRPDITILKLAPHNPLLFKVRTAVYPEISLPDYMAVTKNMAHKSEYVEPTDEEISRVEEEIKKSGAKIKEPVTDIREKIRENLEIEKKTRERDRKRIVMLEAILEKSTVEVPKVLVARELGNMGIKEEDAHKFSSAAKKRVSFELILEKIAEQEHIIVPEDEIRQETERVLNIYKNADKDRARSYVESMLRSEKVFQFLEAENKS